MKIVCTDIWREVRLQKAIYWASVISDVSGDQLAALISEIEDRRGTLVIHWLHEPTQTQRRAFSEAWQVCKEDGDKILHFAPSEGF